MPCKHARASITPAVQADERSPRLGLLSTACSEDLHTRACLVCERACEGMQARSGLSEALAQERGKQALDFQLPPPAASCSNYSSTPALALLPSSFGS